MDEGLKNHAAAVGILQNTEPVFFADLDVAKVAEGKYAAAKSAKTTLATNLRVADSSIRVFLKATSAVLAQTLGKKWSQAWVATGFPDQSTGVPNTQAKRLALCGSLQTYFTNNPTKEVNTPLLVVTGTKAMILAKMFTDASTAVNDGNVLAGQLKVARDAAVTALRTRMSGLIAELGQKLSPVDPLWLAFGLNEPGADATPDVPASLVVTPGIAGVLHLDWADSRLAQHYRVWLFNLGVDTDFQAVASPTDADATLTGLTSGHTVQVRVTAVNGALESLPSNKVLIVVP